MKIPQFILCAIITISLVWVLDSRLSANGGKTPRLGYFLSPQTGFWQNAEPADENFDAALTFPQLTGKAEVYFDERMVPHVYAENEQDAFFIQGYLHAKFRLWQMDFETYAAAGRLSEIMGDSASGKNFLKIDKFFRRLGMVYAAENSLQAMEEDPQSKMACDAYTAGVNAYISSLKEKDYPIEYKLLDYKPEPWTNFKSALFLKYMSFDLAGYEEDFEHTNAKAFFSKEQYEKLFPARLDSVDPIHPVGTKIPPTKFKVVPPANVDSAYFNYKTIVAPANPQVKPNKNNGSNNWAVDSSKTLSKRPILCNDPHLGLNFPSLWYEMQISTPSFNAYGTSFPGAPAIIIGFNDSCAWGFTNSERDARDYYELQFKDSTMQEYMYNGNWEKATFRDEIIKIRGKASDTEHIAITNFGLVMYDKAYPDKLNSGKYYACRWKATDKSNELKTFLQLDHAKNYADYLDAISTYTCPGQNMIFADKSGDIAIRQQAKFPALWYRQGEFVMPGIDSSYLWQGMTPDTLNLTMHNPLRGFVSSANQVPYDAAVYPYYLHGTFYVFRGKLINHQLAAMQNAGVEDMQRLQTNTYNLRAQMARPLFRQYLDIMRLDDEARKYVDVVDEWNLQNDANEIGATVFTLWMDSIMSAVYKDDFSQSALPMPWPDEVTLIEGMLKDSSYEFADDINTPQKETLTDQVTAAFIKIIPVCRQAQKEHRLAWGVYSDGSVQHLLGLAPFSRLHLNGGGGQEIINAFSGKHGPSWRMVVELTDNVNAYGVYPGGQSGNPGSKYYDSFTDQWLAGKYYRLHSYTIEQAHKEKMNGKITFTKS